jgi:hypothetical protein
MMAPRSLMQGIAPQPIYTRGNIYRMVRFLTERRWMPMCGISPAKVIRWKCDANNARSRAAALRLGFRFEGVFQQHMIVKGRNRDTAWFAISDHEWPATRDRFIEYFAGTRRHLAR